MNTARMFLESMIEEDIADCCRQLAGRRIVRRRLAKDKRSITHTEVGAIIIDMLVDRHGADHDRLEIGVCIATHNDNKVMIDIIPGNLYTFLLVSGIKAGNLSNQKSYHTNEGTYFFNRKKGGWFVPVQ